MTGLDDMQDTEAPLHTAAMEAQHETLIELVNLLTERNAAHARKTELSLLLRDLLVFTEQHFKDEEAHMEAIGYGRLDTHQVIHRELLATLRRHINDFDQSEGRIGVQLASFLKFWLIGHINDVDKGLERLATPTSWTSLRSAHRG